MSNHTGRIPGFTYTPKGRNLDPSRSARRVERAAERGADSSSAGASSAGASGASGGQQQQADAAAAAFAAFSHLSDELDELFVGKDSPLLQLRQNETPIEELPAVPPERLLPALLAFVRSSLPTEFRYLTNLTRMAMMAQLAPFMSMQRTPFLGG